MNANVFVQAGAVVGVHVAAVARDAIALAKKLGVGVRVPFNSGLVFAWPDSDEAQLVRDWSTQLGLLAVEVVPEPPRDDEPRRMGF